MLERHRSAALLALAAALAACAEDPNPLEPSLVTYSDLPDLFTFSVVGLDNVSDVAGPFLWVMGGDQAIVDVSSSLTGGSAFLQIRGASGTVVHAEDIRSETDVLTGVDTGGLWEIAVVFEKASGGFDFSVERDTIP
jgi:hypothetical protein